VKYAPSLFLHLRNYTFEERVNKLWSANFVNKLFSFFVLLCYTFIWGKVWDRNKKGLTITIDLCNYWKSSYFLLARISRNFCGYEFGKIVDFGMMSVKFSFRIKRACIWNFSNKKKWYKFLNMLNQLQGRFLK